MTNKLQRRVWRRVLGASACLALVAGCSTPRILTTYPQEMRPLLNDVANGRPIPAERMPDKDASGGDRMLDLMEGGRLAQIENDIPHSRAAFEQAVAAIHASDEEAAIRARDVAVQAGALAMNDTVTAYTPHGYERVMLRHFQALNYLFSGDLEGAGVEVRAANLEQEEALKRHQKEVAKAEADGRAHNLGGASEQPALSGMRSDLDAAAGGVKNSFQNAYTFYMSGVVRELLDEPNDALIDYRRALEICPANACVQRDVARLGRRLGIDVGLAAAPAAPAGGPNAASGDLVILFEDGLVPPKEEVRIPVPIPWLVTMVGVAFPVYRERWSLSAPLTARVDGADVGGTEALCHVRALAARALQEDMPVIVTRQVLRAAAKATLAYEARRKMGDLGGVLVGLYNVVTDRADLRSWLSLPADAQVLRATLPAGKHALVLSPMTGAALTSEVEIRPGGITVVRVIRVGGRTTVATVVFGKKGAHP